MITFLADHDVEGQARSLFAALNAAGWLELVPMRLHLFAEVGLPEDANDRYVWRLCQEHEMVLLTGNRTMLDPDALEAVLRTEAPAESLPVVTVSAPRRIPDPAYLNRCVERLVEIAADLDTYRGAGRVFIP